MGKLKNVEKGYNSATTSPKENKKIWVHLYFMVIPHVKFQDPIQGFY